jgi:hypothetical protein
VADPALQAVGDELATAATVASRKPARRGSGMAAKPALQAVAAPAPSTTTTPAESTSAGEIVGNG